MAKVQRPIEPIHLYRYRSLTRDADAVHQEIDSILNNYLYCSDYTLMNDAMEGFYRPSKVLAGNPEYKDIVREITDSKSGVGIACFTEASYEDVLMWTHYADNCTGMCLAYSTIELRDGLSNHVNLVRLGYVDEPPVIYPSHAHNTANAAVRILSQKKYNWAYEREWRVLGPVGPVSIGRTQAVKTIYFGSRVNLGHRRQILARIQGTNIKAFMMNINGYKYTWKPINAAARPKKKAK